MCLSASERGYFPAMSLMSVYPSEDSLLNPLTGETIGRPLSLARAFFSRSLMANVSEEAALFSFARYIMMSWRGEERRLMFLLQKAVSSTFDPRKPPAGFQKRIVFSPETTGR